jgi:hypothetical protein
MRAASLLLFLLVSACKQAPPKDAGTLLVGSSVGQKSQERTEDMLVRISEIEIDPTHPEEYKAILKEEAAASVRLEPGVIAIFPMHRRDLPVPSGELEQAAASTLQRCSRFAVRTRPIRSRCQS